MSTQVSDSALRFALVQMLGDTAYPDNLKDKERTLERLQATSWDASVREQLKMRARLWAESTDNSVGLALRRALGEEIPRDPVPRHTRAPASADTPARAFTRVKRSHDMESIAERPTEENGVMTPEFERELTIVAHEFERPPYWFPDDTARLARAASLVREGKVTRNPDNTYDVVGSKGTIYTCGDECPCPQGQKAKSKWCAHLIATAVLKEVSARVQPPLFPPPKTIDERIAGHTPKRQEEASMSDTALGDHTLETPVAFKAPSSPAEPRSRSPLPQILPRRSISAIVADLSRPLPKDCIATKTQGGQSISFLHWQTVARLLDTYAPGWHGTVTRIDQVGKACAITYRLTIPCLEGEISREATGQEAEEVTGYGDSTSNSEAMAFKRAAAKFGVGLWLYDKNTDPTARALAEHVKQEKLALLTELGKASDDAQIPRTRVIDWLKAYTGALRNDQIPVAALRALLSHLSMPAQEETAER